MIVVINMAGIKNAGNDNPENRSSEYDWDREFDQLQEESRENVRNVIRIGDLGVAGRLFEVYGISRDANETPKMRDMSATYVAEMCRGYLSSPGMAEINPIKDLPEGEARPYQEIAKDLLKLISENEILGDYTRVQARGILRIYGTSSLLPGDQK